MKKQVAYFVFLLIIAGVLLGELLAIKWIDFAFKPLIMFWIAGFFLIFGTAVEKNVKNFALAAFLFSWLGDISLMFIEKGFIYFLLGLLFFLTAQFFYLFLFFRLMNLTKKIPFLRKKPFCTIPFLIYGLIFYIILYNHLDTVLKIAVLVYMAAILCMSVMALNRKNTVNPQSFLSVFAGSLFFVISDSLLAINKFLGPLAYEGIFVMSTYILAQFLIMQGILLQFRK